MIIREENYRNKSLNTLFYFELLQIIIPLKDFFRSFEQPDIYNGTENIPFDKRETEFKKILLSEFLE
ncbi:MAG: hypothetical protein EAX89_06410 [Candidatus Lokiarchaeota archaeon]|nr:hypothetical protein [Candidatus Lokiarchaeota archaeon]